MSTTFTTITIVTIITAWCYDDFMKRATMTFPPDLAKAVENYRQSQEVPPSLTAVVQAALRQYLAERGFLRRTPETATAQKGSGRREANQSHRRAGARGESWTRLVRRGPQK